MISLTINNIYIYIYLPIKKLNVFFTIGSYNYLSNKMY
jgi:hypothetical protein